MRACTASLAAVSWLSSPRRQGSIRLQQQPISHMARERKLGFSRERVSQSRGGIHSLVLPSPGCGGKAPSSSWAALFLECEAAEWVWHRRLGYLNVDTPDDIFTGWILSWAPRLGRRLTFQEVGDLITDKDVNGAWNAALEMEEKNGIKRWAMPPQLIPLGSAAKKNRIGPSAMGHGVAPSGKPALPRRCRGGQDSAVAASLIQDGAVAASLIPALPRRCRGGKPDPKAGQGPRRGRNEATACSRSCRRQPPIPL